MTTSADPDRDHQVAVDRTMLSLQGLATGDAFGERFFRYDAQESIRRRELPLAPWRYTDDTVMAISIVEVLRRYRRIDPDLLAQQFADRYYDDPSRGYGNAAHDILALIGAGRPWREVAAAPFDGQGSMGNGGAMRAAPLGAYFADDLEAAAQNARLSAMVTHAHPEGQAGAIAVAVAAAAVVRDENLLETAIAFTPAGATRDGLLRAVDIPEGTPIDAVVVELGNGSRVIASDTVPFALWCATQYLVDYKESLWATVSGLGDRDTTCAIVGGIVSLAPGQAPAVDWYGSTEPIRFEIAE